MHRHTCMYCPTVVAEGEFDCDEDRDHDFGACAKHALWTSARYEVAVIDDRGEYDGVGDTAEFATIEEARLLIDELRQLGDDWRDARYVVFEHPAGAQSDWRRDRVYEIHEP